jgi:hypothetical protein
VSKRFHIIVGLAFLLNFTNVFRGGGAGVDLFELGIAIAFASVVPCAWLGLQLGVISTGTAMTLEISAAISLLFALIGRGNVVFSIFIMAPAVVVALITLFIGVLYWGNAVENPSHRRYARRCFAVAFVLFNPLISIPIGRALDNHDIAAAKRYCESLEPSLEQYKQTNGQYPADISRIPIQGSLPRLLRGGPFYFGNGDYHVFNFMPAGVFLFGGLEWYSGDRVWREWH